MNLTYRSLPNAILWGIAGGAGLLLCAMLSTRGLSQILPYPLALIGAVITGKYAVDFSFRNSFLTGVVTFLTMTLILLVFAVMRNGSGEGSLFFFAWRMAVAAAIAIPASLLLALLAKPVPQR